MREYVAALWSRRAFISEFSRSGLREQNYGSIFGQLWLILNPLLLSAVYFLLIYVIGGSSDASRFGHLTATLFLFYLIANSLTGGVKAITSGERLILNTSFPRIMLPISATVIALFKFLPTVVVFTVIHLLIGITIFMADALGDSNTVYCPCDGTRYVDSYFMHQCLFPRYFKYLALSDS